ncbi:MAG: NADH dehydrogenase (quinone) subunit D [Deltaproteobacteria bacterium]|nr:NADH dehydrogenase (quinone) subunit D [Deltaproteobacteria bacterium]
MSEPSGGDLNTKPMHLNIGPNHPAMHGTLRLYCELDGETIIKAIPEIGYLHRGFEKHAENSDYTQVIPYTDRLNYVSPMMNNVGFCLAVEELFHVSIPERAQVCRVIACEMNRIMDHLVCVGTNAVDLGALTNFWYFFNVREKMYNLIEGMCGARLTTNYTRIGGVSRDLPENFEPTLRSVLKDLRQSIDDVSSLLQRNKIFLDRTVDIGVVSQADAISYGFTGPCLRATGVARDIRKDKPYLGYEQYDFEVVVGEHGDSFDRLFVRVEEMNQSIRIIEQALAKLKPGPIVSEDHRVALPPKAQVYTSIEALMNHFKLIYEGVRPPPGEIYSSTEAANGELGFYIVSDGSKNPYRVKVRPPCFAIYAAFPQMITGGMIADAIAILGNLNVVAGELDR